MSAQKLVIAGGSGFLGQSLVAWFVPRGWDVVVLSRQPARSTAGERIVVWDGVTLGDWVGELDWAAALVNLAGRSVNCRYHARNRRQMMDSRILSTRILGEAIARSSRPPAVWLNSSTATIYKHSYDRPMDEATGVIGATPEAKDAFSIEIATAWEREFAQAITCGTRKVIMRTAMVLGPQAGTVYRVLRRLARWRLGGPMAGGRQYISWLHETDFCRAIEWLIEREDFCGVVNLTAPQPITNRHMMRAMRRAVHMPIGLPATRWMLEIGTWFLRTESELVIKSRRVVPGRLTAAGFHFKYPTIDSAIAELEHRLRGKRLGDPAEAPAKSHESESSAATMHA